MRSAVQYTGAYYCGPASEFAYICTSRPTKHIEENCWLRANGKKPLHVVNEPIQLLIIILNLSHNEDHQMRMHLAVQYTGVY